jgi:hypothetical protein
MLIDTKTNISKKTGKMRTVYNILIVITYAFINRLSATSGERKLCLIF